MKIHLTAACVCMAAVNIFGEPFSNLGFDAALKQAGKTHKVVLVDFYTTWCGPCKLLDKNTWTDAEVIKSLQEKTVALRIDAEAQTNLAARYHIEAYPTILLAKPDGTELDRLVGYRDPKTFLADFNASLDGKDSITRAKEALRVAGGDDPMARLKYAQSLANRGMNAEALQEYLWCFDHGLEHSPAFLGVRLSFLLNDIKNLGGHYPAASKALEDRRNERQAKVMAGSADRQTVVDLVALNGILDQKEKNLAVFDQLPAESPLRTTVADLIEDQLLEAKRYKDIVAAQDPKAAFAKQVTQLDQILKVIPADNPQKQQLEEGLRSRAVTSGAEGFEALAGLKRNEEARELAGQILKFDSSASTRAVLAKAAVRADNAELVQYVNNK